MKHFDSLNDYYRFALAREFVEKENNNIFSCQENTWERIGGFLVKPLFQPGDYLIKNIRNPLLITAAVIIGLALTTLVFYPALIPGLLSLTSATKLSVYVMTQSTIIGVCLRTLGRLNNHKLMNAWINKQLIPVTIGSEIILA